MGLYFSRMSNPQAFIPITTNPAPDRVTTLITVQLSTLVGSSSNLSISSLAVSMILPFLVKLARGPSPSPPPINRTPEDALFYDDIFIKLPFKLHLFSIFIRSYRS